MGEEGGGIRKIGENLLYLWHIDLTIVLNSNTMKKFEDIQFAVEGTDFVGLSTAALLAKTHKVSIVEAMPEEAHKIKNADFVVITSDFENAIDGILEVNPEAVIVIRANVPVGYTRSLYVKYWKKFQAEGLDSSHKLKLLYSPLDENRIIVGYPKMIADQDEENVAIRAIASNHSQENAKTFATVLQAACDGAEAVLMGMKEAESLEA